MTNLPQTSNEVYGFSKLRRFLAYVNFMTQDTLRFLVQASLDEFVRYSSNTFLPPTKPDQCQTARYPQPVATMQTPKCCIIQHIKTVSLEMKLGSHLPYLHFPPSVSFFRFLLRACLHDVKIVSSNKAILKIPILPFGVNPSPEDSATARPPTPSAQLDPSPGNGSGSSSGNDDGNNDDGSPREQEAGDGQGDGGDLHRACRRG